MEQILCPECGGSKIVDLGNNQYECRYCGKKFQFSPTPQPQPVNPQPVYPQQAQQPQYSNVPPQYNNMQQPPLNFTPDMEDKPGCLMNGLCFLIWPLGIGLYFSKKGTQPKCASSYLRWGLAGLALTIIWQIATQ